jgi:hypothetical protein
MEDGHIRPIIDWSLTFGQYAAKIQQIEAAEHELEAISDRFDEATLRRDRVKEASTFIESAELIAIYKESVEDAEKLVFAFEKVAQADKRQCEQYQDYYFGFEKRYFNELSQSYKNKKKQ